MQIINISIPYILQLAINGIIAASIYSLIAFGFSLIYTTNRFVYFAHGGNIVASAYMLYFFFNVIKLPIVFAIAATVICSSTLGALVYKLLFMKLRNNNSSKQVMLIMSVAVLILLENIILLVFSSNVKTYGLRTYGKGIEIQGAIITDFQLLIFISCLVLFITLYCFLNYTKYGLKIKAVSNDTILSNIAGINANRIQFVSFVIASVLACIAGILIGIEQNVEYSMGSTYIIKGFSSAVIGGIDNMLGVIIGSIFLGFAENFGILIVPSYFKEVIGLVFLTVFLVFKPNGILGLKSRE